jgi:cephalosporin hydroxylase
LEIERVFEENFLRSAPHPWLLIEDAHVNVYGVLSHFHPYLHKGEYVIVEDSMNTGKLEAILRFMNEYRGHYKVDTYYTDFFGRNATCAQDSIFVRV